MAALLRLPLFLQKSKRLYVLFDQRYTTRLWCVWELAVYLKIRKNPKVVFISIEKRIIEMTTLVVLTLLQLGIDVTTDVANSRVKDNQPWDTRTAYEVTAWVTFCVYFAVTTMMYVFGDVYYRSLHDLRTTFATFDVTKAELGNERDRVHLLKVVDELFEQRVNGADAPFATGLEVFNRELQTRVRRQLPVTGMRSWKVIGYVTAVLVHGCTNVLDYFDDWGYAQAGDPYDLERTVIAPGVTRTMAYGNFRLRSIESIHANKLSTSRN